MIESWDDSLDKDDVIYSDPNELELVEDVSVVIEDDAEKAQRLYDLLTGSASGVELYLICTTKFPTNSGGHIGRNVVMNRVMRYRSTQGKLKSGKIFWRNARSETILEVEKVFATIEKHVEGHSGRHRAAESTFTQQEVVVSYQGSDIL